MRFLCFLFLAAVVAVVVIFALQNQHVIHVGFFDYGLDASVAAVVGAAYVLGMLSGWSVIGMLKRSFHRMTEQPQQQYSSQR